MIKLIRYKNPTSLSEIFQSLDVKFAFVDANMEEIQMPGKCRDFLGDIVWCNKTKYGKYSIWGSEFDPEEYIWDESITRLSMHFPNKNVLTTFKLNFSKLNKLEERYGINPSILHDTNHKLILVVEGSSVWQDHEWKISYYSFILKTLCYPTLEDLKKPEIEYYKMYDTGGWESVFMSSLSIPCNVHVTHDKVYDAHNHSGFVSIMKNEDHVVRPFINLVAETV